MEPFWSSLIQINLTLTIFLTQLETTISQLQAHLDAKNKEATELKTKYNLQTEQPR